MSEEEKKLYHGTQKVFDKFNRLLTHRDAIYGQGVYLTDDPLIASEYALFKQDVDAGELIGSPNIRPYKLGFDEKYVLDLTKKVDEKSYDEIINIMIERQQGEYGKRFFADLKKQSKADSFKNWDELYSQLVNAQLSANNYENVLDYDNTLKARSMVNKGIKNMGYLGIKYQGGIRLSGKKHNAYVIFKPEYLVELYRKESGAISPLALTQGAKKLAGTGAKIGKAVAPMGTLAAVGQVARDFPQVGQYIDKANIPREVMDLLATTGDVMDYPIQRGMELTGLDWVLGKALEGGAVGLNSFLEGLSQMKRQGGKTRRPEGLDMKAFMESLGRVNHE